MSKKFKAVCNVCGAELKIETYTYTQRGYYFDEEATGTRTICPNGCHKK